MRRVCLVASLFTAIPVTASADEKGEVLSPPIEVTREDYQGVHWDERWARMHPAEYVAAPAAIVGAFVLSLVPEPNLEPNWRGGVLFDDAFLDATFVDDPDAYQAWQKIGDVGFYGSFALAAEPLVAAMIRNPDVGWQAAWISLEGYSVFASALYLSQFLVRRERPVNTRFCDATANASGAEVDDYSVECGSENATRGFIGGHVGAAATATALACVHHAYLGLYGGGVADALPCGAGIVATGMVFTARSVAGRHYVTDNILGLGLGVLSGAVVPWALHYGRDALPAPSAAGVMPALMPTEDGLQVGVVGIAP